MNSSKNQRPDFHSDESGAIFNPETLDTVLDELRAGKTGINQETGAETEDTAVSAPLPSSSETGNETDTFGRTDGKETGKPHQRKKKKQEEEKPFSLKEEIISWIQVLVTAAVIAFCINTFLIANSQVPTGSMETTIMPGDRVIGSRLSYRFGEPERGDIAIFIYPDDEARGIKTYYVKRIIGMPGDTIDIINGQLYLNGSDTPLDEPYIREAMIPEEPMHYEVPEDSYFMMGDNRNYSNDSRRWTNTFVHKKKLVAKVLFQYFPKFQKLE